MDLGARKTRYTELRATGYTLPTRIEEHVLAVYHRATRTTRTCLYADCTVRVLQNKCKVTDHRGLT